MTAILALCSGQERLSFAPGTVLLGEGRSTGRLFVLGEGTLEVVRDGTVVAAVDDAGAVFGEMSVLLSTPHTATVRGKTSGWAYRIEDAAAFLRAHPEVAFEIAEMLARRLNAATTYLVDLKHQFAGHGNHLEMVGEVLESLIHRQPTTLKPGSDRQSDPRL